MRTCDINVDPWFKYPLLALTVTSYLLYEHTCYSCHTFYACYTCYVCYTLATIHLLRLLQFICYIYYPCYVCLLHFLPLLCWLRLQRFLKLLRLLHSTGGINRQPYQNLSVSWGILFIYLFILSKLVQFSISCKKLINQDFDQPIRTPLQWGIPHL